MNDDPNRARQKNRAFEEELMQSIAEAQARYKWALKQGWDEAKGGHGGMSLGEIEKLSRQRQAARDEAEVASRRAINEQDMQLDRRQERRQRL